ncbi:MAG TPA: hypothetical protein VNS32_06790 [Flavisolibacter sp.]|nr:hypothetical protein [Flavisolibacter sp.]
MQVFEHDIRLTSSVLIKYSAPPSPESAIGKYKCLLKKIGIGLGFTETESGLLAQQVIDDAIKNNCRRNDHLSPRVWLSKIMVRKCVFTISNLLFSSKNIDSKNKFPTAKTIPLSFRTVLILYNSVGFNEMEIAEILNTTVMEVKHRLNKALASIHKT